jgi:hypothetical protein
VGQRVLYAAFPIVLLFLLALTVLLTGKIFLSSLAYLLLVAFLVFSISLIAKFSFLDARLVATHWRYLAYAVIFIAAYNLSMQFGLKVATIEKSVFFAFVLVVIFVLVQLIYPEMWLINAVSNRRVIGSLGLQIGGPFVWSYSLGHLLILIAFTLLARLGFQQAGLPSKVLLMVCLLLIALSQSKAVYLAFTFLAIYLITVSFGSKARGKKSAPFLWLTIASILAFSAIWFSGQELGNITRFLESFAAGGIDASTKTRMNQIALVTQAISQNPLFGYPIRYLVIENAYAHYVYYFGVVGLLTYFVILGSIGVTNWSICRATLSDARFTPMRPFAIGFLAYSVSTIILSLAYAPLDGHKTAYVFWFLLGCYQGAFRGQSLSSVFGKT